MSMVIADFNFVGVCPRPTEAKTPLIVDADGMLAATISCECFEPVARRCRQVRELDGFVELNEFSVGRSTDGTVDPAFAGLVESFSLSIPK